MGKRRRQECDCGKRRRKHLYLVLDDWDNGFSLHKMDALSLLDDSDDDGGRELERLPDPPAVRITEARQSPMLFAGLGTSIFVANKIQRSPKVTGALVYDTETAAIAMGPAPGEHMLLLRRQHEGPLGGVSVHALSWARSPAALAEAWLPSHEGAWESVAAPTAPFDGNEEPVVSSAVHGRAHHILLDEKQGVATRRHLFLRHEAAGVEVARGMGAAFHQAGYFEREIDAWVGLHEDGYICCCRAATATPGAAPEWRKTEQKLYREGDRDRRLGATLTYMGNNVFCLVESVVREDVDPGRAYGGGRGCALHVTVFGLKYNREGEVQATLRRVTKSYAVSKYIPDFTHEAFWM
ncbi:hypothetical protein ZWY2020_008382 [Hordeum vulgare]|nr:hypothetical protein ZWY2020_008382 [Hordeum vulgare]